MTKRTRFEVYVLAALAILLAVALYAEYSGNSGLGGVQADGAQFVPLDVPDPSLRVDLLHRIQKEEYNGQHRNIFSAEPLPPSPAEVAAQQQEAKGPAVPAGPPPVTVPATFYGIVTELSTGVKRACFSANSDDVYIVPEGGTLLNQFRVVKIGNNSVEMEELSSGRHTTLRLAQPTDAASESGPQGQP